MGNGSSLMILQDSVDVKTVEGFEIMSQLL